MIARELGFVYIDSGAMYRAVALYCLENKILSGDKMDMPRLVNELGKINIRFMINPCNGLQETWLNGVNVEEKIRGIAVSSIVSSVSRIAEVRKAMVALQQEMGKAGKVVMDGRDIGTVVFPGARLKIFMTADPTVRARRRFDELMQKGVHVKLEEIAENIRMRDHEDENRAVSPLRKADDAFILDNSHMTVNQQMEWFHEKWREKNEH